MKKLKPGNSYRPKTFLFYTAMLIILAGMAVSSCKTPQNAYYFKTIPRDTSIHSEINRVAE